MTPKEKAENIYYTYYQIVSDCEYPKELAKKCSLLGIYIAIEAHSSIFSESQDFEKSRNYWLNVKEEIKKI
jgi:hypothetical protein